MDENKSGDSYQIMKPPRWNTPDYQRIISAKFVNGKLSVTFADGSVVSTDPSALLPFDVRDLNGDTINIEDPFEIVVSTSQGETAIPWSTIRLLSDNEFAAHWAKATEKQSEQVGLRLKALRKKRKLASREVAARAGITPQSLSRIEHGHHDVVFTTLEKILAAMGCTLTDLAETEVTPPSLGVLLKRLEQAGLKKEWILDRILPGEFLACLETNGVNGQGHLKEAADYISRIFPWSAADILSARPLQLDPALVASAKFKAPGRVREHEMTAYAVYAHYLALLVLNATQHIQMKPIPHGVDEIRRDMAKRYGTVTLENLLHYVWDLGIPVIPLADSGAFHGACWNIAGRCVIVLKQVTPFQARWLSDLAHEAGHVSRHLRNEADGIIESEEITPFTTVGPEQEASEFASMLLLYGRAEELTDKCVNTARHKLEYLKSAVIQIAAAEHIPVDVLANYVAYRLSMQNENWWGAANHLQITEPAPQEIARRILLERIDLNRLNPEDRDLVLRALV